MTGPAGPYHHHVAYGLKWRADLPLAQFSVAEAGGVPDVEVRRIDRLPDREVLHRIHRGEVFADGFRFRWAEDITFDMRHDRASGRTLLAWCPGPAWRGGFPHALFGTVTGLLLAWRGIMPMHGCAVAIDGRGVLIAGVSGAGKSMLSAGLVARGATLLSDDLSALVSMADGEWLQPGRPALRLYPEIAGWLDGATRSDAGPAARGKLLVRPAMAPAHAAVPLAAILLIDHDPVPDPAVLKVALLREQLFRPRWLAKLPGQPARLTRLARLATDVPMLTIEPAAELDQAGWRARAARAAALIGAAADGAQAARMNQPV